VNPLLRELLEIAGRFEAGQLTDPFVDPEQERFAVRVERAAAVDLTLLETGPHVTRLHATGDLVVSDQRLVVVADGEPVHTWSWSDVSNLALLRDGLGVALLPTEALHAAGTRTLFGPVTARLLEHPPPSPAETVPLGLRWLMVEGAFWAHREDLDGWRERLRSLPW